MNALSGDLAVFPPADVLQFLGYVRADGMVELCRDAHRARVYLENGRVSAAVADFARPRLGELLRESDSLGQAALEFGLARSAAEGRPLGEALVDLGLLTAEELTRALEEQLLRTLCPMLAWERGSFQFRAGVGADGPRLPVRPPLDRLLFEALKRLDEEAEKLGRAAP
ncbi:MAG TPA: DUF4388 domain-containing protein [Candidatus Saccharimonadales bacterium]|nr:DUF4388 domain-containing protein [Candidatus Saccharimonadales bacterium]